MQIDAAATTRLIPSPRPSASHANFDVLALSEPTGRTRYVGLVAGSRFWMSRGSSFDDAVAGARELAAAKGGAFAVLAAHPGQLFVVPAFVRGGASGGSDAPLAADLAPLAGWTTTGRHGRALAIVGTEQVIDLRGLPTTLGTSRG